jgi:hypothetical protein
VILDDNDENVDVGGRGAKKLQRITDVVTAVQQDSRDIRSWNSLASYSVLPFSFIVEGVMYTSAVMCLGRVALLEPHNIAHWQILSQVIPAHLPLRIGGDVLTRSSAEIRCVELGMRGKGKGVGGETPAIMAQRWVRLGDVLPRDRTHTINNQEFGRLECFKMAAELCLQTPGAWVGIADMLSLVPGRGGEQEKEADTTATSPSTATTSAPMTTVTICGVAYDKIGAYAQALYYDNTNHVAWFHLSMILPPNGGVSVRGRFVSKFQCQANCEAIRQTARIPYVSKANMTKAELKVVMEAERLKRRANVVAKGMYSEATRNH